MRAGLFVQVVSIEARRRMSYAVDFWINAVVGFAAEFAIVWFLWTALYKESGHTTIAGYDFDAILLYYVVAILVGKIVRGAEFEGHVSQDIYEGSLNRYLVLPASYVAFKYAQQVGSLLPALVQAVLFGTLWFFIAGGRGGSAITPATVLMGTSALVLANLLFYAMSFPLHAVAFWADNVWSLIVALRFVANLLGGLLFPLALFPENVQAVNRWLPFRNLFALPAETLLGRSGFQVWAQGMAVGLAWLVILGAIGRQVWRRGCLQYGGVGI